MIASRERFRKALDGHEPDHWLSLGRLVLPAGGRHGAHLHPIVAGNPDLQRLCRITPLSCRTAPASPRKSPGGVVGPLHPCGRIARIRRPWPLSLRRRAPRPRLLLTGCALSNPTSRLPSGACRVSDRLSPCGRSAVASVRSATNFTRCPIPLMNSVRPRRPGSASRARAGARGSGPSCPSRNRGSGARRRSGMRHSSLTTPGRLSRGLFRDDPRRPTQGGTPTCMSDHSSFRRLHGVPDKGRQALEGWDVCRNCGRGTPSGPDP